MTQEEKLSLAALLNKVAIAAAQGVSVEAVLTEIAIEFDLDAEMIFCGPPTDDYVAIIGWVYPPPKPQRR